MTPSGLRGVQYALLVAGEAAWLYAWSVAVGTWLGGSQSPLLPATALAALLAASAMATRQAAAHKRHPRLARVALGLLGLAVAVLTALGPWLATGGWGSWGSGYGRMTRPGDDLRAVAEGCLVLLVWWRGIGIGRARPTPYQVERRFWTGVLALAGLLVVVALAGRASGLTPGALILPTLAFVFVGLIAMPLSRIAELSSGPSRRGAPALTPSGPWLATLLGVVTALLLVTLVLAQLVAFDRLGALLEPLGAILWMILYVVLLPFAFLAEGLIFVARRLLRLQLPLGGRDRPVMDALEQLRQQERSGGPVAPELLTALKVLLLVALAAAVVGLLARAVSHLRDRATEDGVEEVRDLVWSWPGLGAIWRWLLAWIRPRLAGAGAAEATRPIGAGVAASIRELYREFLALGASVGRPRRPVETPHEYESRLRGEPALPGADEVHSITESYVRVRYGPPAPRQPDLGPIAAALARLREAWLERGRGTGTSVQ